VVRNHDKSVCEQSHEHPHCFAIILAIYPYLPQSQGRFTLKSNFSPPKNNLLAVYPRFSMVKPYETSIFDGTPQLLVGSLPFRCSLPPPARFSKGHNLWLVLWNHGLFMTFHGNVIIPTDEHIFFRGVGQPQTRISGHFLCIVEKQWCLGVLQSNGRLWSGAWSDLAWSPATVAIAGKITCKWRNLGCSWMLSPCRFWVAFALFAA
jgi:hypothetical protein